MPGPRRRILPVLIPPILILTVLAALLALPPWGSSALPSPAVPAPAAAPPAVTPAASAPRADAVTGPVFSRPGDARVRHLLTRNLRRTPPGAVVRVVTWTFDSRPLARELLRASRRGVRVQVLVGGISCGEPAVRRLGRMLAGGSQLRCAERSARGHDTFDGGEANLHQKSWTFSAVGATRFVTVVTSANATDVADEQQYTDAYQFAEQAVLYREMSTVFAQQWRDRPMRRPFRERAVSASESVLFTPWNGPRMADPVLRRIAALPDDAEVRVAQSNWSGRRGERIARALAAKVRAGMELQVLASRPFSPLARRTLLRAGVPVADGWFGPRRYHHLKLMTARYVEDGVTRTRVWTGSENWWGPSRGHDELVVEIGDPDAYRAYSAFLDAVTADAKAASGRSTRSCGRAFTSPSPCGQRPVID